MPNGGAWSSSRTRTVRSDAVRERPMSTIPVRVADAQRGNAQWLRYTAHALIALMAGLHLAAGYGTSGVPDLFRDLYWAQAILDGEAFPLRGPVIYNTIELGPWWYYLTALVLAVTGSLAGSAALVALLAAVKYLLAWRLGNRIGDAGLGLCAVVALVVPGWSAAPLGFPT